ncbi:MAG: hypothetical protein U9N34_08445, partial [Candidatus Cloacimonadota bacterium]|nr:hypothetical protein [Candidatus Cloacimonadota bacterium]
MMKPIKQQIKEKTDNFNDNGKVKHLFEIIQYCLQMLPDLETASLGINDETIDQLVSSIKFILLVKKESLNNTNSIKTNEFNKIQQENNKREKQITIKKQ